MKLQARSEPCSLSSQCRTLWMLPCSPSTAALCEQYACSCPLGAYVMSSRQILRGKYLLAPHGGNNNMISSKHVLPLLWCRFHWSQKTSSLSKGVLARSAVFSLQCVFCWQGGHFRKIRTKNYAKGLSKFILDWGIVGVWYYISFGHTT